MTTPIVLTEVEPIFGDSYETADYRRCNFCSEGVHHDIWANKDQDEWRHFYELVGKGVICCEHCLPEALEDLE